VARKLREIVETKISLEYHDALNPAIWDGGRMRPDVRAKLLGFANAFAEFAKIPESVIQDVLFTGGNANFNYTKFSDLDVHVLIDRGALSTDRALVDAYLADKKALWTLKHPNLKIAGYGVEPYAQDLTEKPKAGQGVYSLLDDEWVQRPSNVGANFALDTGLKKRVMSMIHAVDAVVKNDAGLDAMKTLKDKLAAGRGESIAQDGEFAMDNLVFKELRSRGQLRRMTNYINSKIEQRIMSS
jgi:hypothetical protein